MQIRVPTREELEAHEVDAGLLGEGKKSKRNDSKPSPLDERLTIDQAVKKRVPGRAALMGLNTDQTCIFQYPEAQYLQKMWEDQLHYDEENYRVSLGGVEIDNPCNSYSISELEFPARAFLNIWDAEDPRHYGLKTSPWMQELINERERLEKLSESNKEESAGGALVADAERPADFEAEPFQKASGLFPGLASVIRCAVAAANAPGGALPLQEILRAQLRLAAKQDGWGSGRNGEIANCQLEVLVQVLSGGPKTAGRPRKGSSRK